MDTTSVLLNIEWDNSISKSGRHQKNCIKFEADGNRVHFTYYAIFDLSVFDFDDVRVEFNKADVARFFTTVKESGRAELRHEEKALTLLLARTPDYRFAITVIHNNESYTHHFDKIPQTALQYA